MNQPTRWFQTVRYLGGLLIVTLLSLVLDRKLGIQTTKAPMASADRMAKVALKEICVMKTPDKAVPMAPMANIDKV